MSAFYSFFGTVLGFFSKISGGSYLLGLFIFAILIKLVLLPFSIKQQKSSVKQAALTPYAAAIRKKYAGREDRPTMMKMQEELQALYQKEGYNPMGGCMPMLIQLVIIMLLYQVIMNPLFYVIKSSPESVYAAQAYITASVEDGGLDRGDDINKSYSQIDILKIINEYDKEEFTAGLESFLTSENFSSYVTEKLTTGTDKEKSGYQYLTQFTTLVEGQYKLKQETSYYTSEIEKVYDPDAPTFDLFGIKNFIAERPNVKSLVTFPWTNLVWLILIPVLNFVSQVVTMKMTKKMTFQPMQEMQQQQAGGCSPKMMEWSMPIMLVFITFSVPAAIGIYWIFNNILSMAQTFVLHKAIPNPVFTEEDYKEAEKALKGTQKTEKLPKAVEGERSNPNSLHTIDFEDEDYAVLPEYESIYDKSKEEKEELNVKNSAEPNEAVKPAPLKEKKKKK